MQADPTPGAALGATPTAVQLTFTESASAALATIRVVDGRGVAYATGRPEPSPNPKVVLQRVRAMPRGVYSVDWRVVSAVDGHVTAGVYAFGVGEAPSAAAASRSTTPPPSGVEVAGRWLLIAGLVLLLGAAGGGIFRFADARGGRVAPVAWAMTAVGLVVLAVAQRANAATTFTNFLRTSVGRAIEWRALAVAIAGVALALGRHGARWARRSAMVVVGAAAAAAIAVHVAAGHAATGSTWSAQTAAQWAHFTAVGLWLGGLAALLDHVRGAPSTTTTAAVRRFSSVAAGGIAAVAVTGTVRAFAELETWHEVFTTGYGRAVVAKVALISTIGLLAARNRWRNVPTVATALAPLRRTSRHELTLAGIALAVAALLGALAPPAAARPAPPAITVAGSDVATTVRVRLAVASEQPGPNRFTVRAVDYDSRRALRAARVQLRFTALDDADVVPSELALGRQRDGSYAASGPNLVFDGRWRVDVLVQRAADSVTVPLTIEARVAQPLAAVVRPTGRPTLYAVQVGSEIVQLSLSRERPGVRRLIIALVTGFQEVAPLDSVVLTATESGRVQEQIVRRIDAGVFTADVRLRRGSNPITVVAKTAAGVRRRAVFDIALR